MTKYTNFWAKKSPLVSEDKTAVICSICKDPYNKDHMPVGTDCGHYFGKECLDRHLRHGSLSKACPVCQRSLHYDPLWSEKRRFDGRPGFAPESPQEITPKLPDGLSRAEIEGYALEIWEQLTQMSREVQDSFVIITEQEWGQYPGFICRTARAPLEELSREDEQIVRKIACKVNQRLMTEVVNPESQEHHILYETWHRMLVSSQFTYALQLTWRILSATRMIGVVAQFMVPTSFESLNSSVSGVLHFHEMNKFCHTINWETWEEASRRSHGKGADLYYNQLMAKSVPARTKSRFAGGLPYEVVSGFNLFFTGVASNSFYQHVKTLPETIQNHRRSLK